MLDYASVPVHSMLAGPVDYELVAADHEKYRIHRSRNIRRQSVIND